MPISTHFAETPLPTTSQKYLLVLMALFVPPLPIYLLSGPKHTIKTKEFFLSLLLAILVWFAGTLYSIYFVCVAFPESKNEGYFRLDDEERQPIVAASEPQSESRESQESPSEHVSAEGTSAAGEEGLPAYEEIQIPPTLEFKGDHKVQQ